MFIAQSACVLYMLLKTGPSFTLVEGKWQMNFNRIQTQVKQRLKQPRNEKLFWTNTNCTKRLNLNFAQSFISDKCNWQWQNQTQIYWSTRCLKL